MDSNCCICNHYTLAGSTIRGNQYCEKHHPSSLLIDLAKDIQEIKTKMDEVLVKIRTIEKKQL